MPKVILTKFLSQKSRSRRTLLFTIMLYVNLFTIISLPLKIYFLLHNNLPQNAVVYQKAMYQWKGKIVRFSHAIFDHATFSFSDRWIMKHRRLRNIFLWNQSEKCISRDIDEKLKPDTQDKHIGFFLFPRVWQ